MNDQKNMILAIALSVAILVLFETFFNTSSVPPQQTVEQQTAQNAPAQGVPATPSSGALPQAPAIPGTAPRKSVV